jgi:DnaK suppressor protein
MKPAPKKIPAKWAWHHQTLLRLRAKLREARAEHDHAARAPHERGGADALDFAEDEVELRTLRTELAQEDFELNEIEAALERLQNGTYGRCEVTSRPIAAPRLRAIPWTRLSKAAAEQRESAKRGPGGKPRRML